MYNQLTSWAIAAQQIPVLNPLAEKIGVVSPCISCASHAADDNTIKWISNLDMMNLPEVSEFLPYFHTILHHFQLSAKSLSTLNEME